jgi:hypothetical protein
MEEIFPLQPPSKTKGGPPSEFEVGDGPTMFAWEAPSEC